MALRDFQQEVENGIFTSWNEPNVFNVMSVMPTGAGKTVLMGDIIAKMNRPTCAIAHRQELVSQVSLALNREGIHHGIIAPKTTQQQIIRLHHETHGYSRYKSRSDVRVAGVDSLRDADTKDRWFASVGLTVIDEGHHVLATNKWGKAFTLFPNSRGLFLTAHAYRADGCGLGRHASGLVDRLVLGPTCRELITRGFLTDYDIYCPESDIDFSEVDISPTTGDYVLPKLRDATHKSKQLVGSVVNEYLKLAAGKLGVTFAVDIEEAKKLAAAYNAAGVPAEIITAKTPITVRGQFMRLFRERKILQLVSVDCLGEGVDVPAIEVVSLARRTASFQLYAQQTGRALRVLVSDDEARLWGSYSDWERLARIAASPKSRAVIIDHVGNTVYFAQYHGRLCSRQSYTTDDRESKIRPRNGADSLRPCSQGFKPPDMVNIVKGCLKPYEKFYTACPYCGVIPFVAGRAQPEQVDGDIVLLDPAVLVALQNEISKIDGPVRLPSNISAEVAGAIKKNHYNRQRHQASLRHVMALWGGWRIHLGEDLRQAQKRFYLTYAVDVVTACTLSTGEADALATRIQKDLTANNVVEAKSSEIWKY